MKRIMRTNPTTMPQPVGNYTHITKIPRNAELFVLSGQIGTDIEGHLPKAFNAQVRNTFQNIQSALQTENLNATNIIKVNIWAVEPIDWDYFDEEWDLFFPKEYPAMTIGYISALGLPEIKIEVEIWAANS